MAEVLSPGTLRATLNYHLEPERGGSEVWCPGTVRDKRRPHEHRQVNVINIRGREKEFSVDKQGFQVDPFETSVDDVDDDADFAGQYYDDVVKHLEKVTGASKVIPVVHIVRRKPWDQVFNAEKDMPDSAPVTAPSYNRSVHIDQSYFGATLVRDNKLKNFPDSVTTPLKSSRWAIINLWRPLHSPVTRDNLALCDARTASEDDLTAVYAELPKSLTEAKSGYRFAAGSKSEAWEVKANPKHEWYYAKEMRPDEALLIKQFDSKDDGSVARRTPHSAFESEEDWGGVRQSIEVRCLVFWEE